MKTATIKDFKEGAKLIAKEGGWTFNIKKQYAEGIWETCEGNIVFEGEAHFYFTE